MSSFAQSIRIKNPISVLIVTTVLLLQLVNFSFFVDSGRIWTLFFVTFGTLGLGLWFVIVCRSIAFSVVHVWAVTAWLLIFTGAFQAFNISWALLSSGIALIYLFNFFLLTNFSWDCRGFAESMVDALLFFGLIAALLGLYEYVSFITCGPSYSPLIPDILPPDFDLRVSGPYGQANLFALFLTLVLLAFFYRMLHSPGQSCRRWSIWLRCLPVLTVATVFFFTYSRGGVVSLSLIVGVMVWMVATRRYLSGNSAGRREFVVLLICLAIGLLVSQVNLPGMFGLPGGENRGARLISEEVGNFSNTEGRLVLWTSAVLIFFDHPWFGVGLDNYRFLMNGYGPKAHDALGFVEFEAMRPSFWVHNEFLQLLCEGGIFFFIIGLFLLFLFMFKIWERFIKENHKGPPIFLYSHFFLFPFLIQSLFEWPLRHPALLLLFVVFAGVLVSQYPLKTVNLPVRARVAAAALILCAGVVAGVLFIQERKITAFKHDLLTQPMEATLAEFSVLAKHPYSSYRILHNALPRYTSMALFDENVGPAQTILPYSEKLVSLEGNAYQWYDLARLYLRVNRLEEARVAIRNAFELRPTDSEIFEFLHHLNVIKASLATGQPIESFYPVWLKPVKINFQELKYE